MVCWELGQKAQFKKIATFLSIVINRDFWLRFLLHKKALTSFLHPLTICDKVASGNKNEKKAQLEKLPQSYQLLSIVINSDFWLRFFTT
jgi:hypothetical protein